MKRRDLAKKYFPEKSDKSAVWKLHNWIMNCPDLVAALEALGLPYKNRRELTIRQVRIIMEYLGDP